MKCKHKSENLQGFTYDLTCVSWGLCHICGELITLYAIDWWKLAWRLFDV